MAKDPLEMMLAYYEDNDVPIPSASDIHTIKSDNPTSYILPTLTNGADSLTIVVQRRPHNPGMAQQ